jgi:hypothetical protein
MSNTHAPRTVCIRPGQSFQDFVQERIDDAYRTQCFENAVMRSLNIKLDDMRWDIFRTMSDDEKNATLDSWKSQFPTLMRTEDLVVNVPNRLHL